MNSIDGNTFAIFSKRSKNYACVFSLIAILSAINTPPSRAGAVNPIAPSSMDLSTKAGDPVAMGMGGAYLLNLGGPQAGVYNPAQVNNAYGVEDTGQVGVSTSNVNVMNAYSYYTDLMALMKDGNSPTLSDITSVAKDVKAANGPFTIQAQPMVGLGIGGQLGLVLNSNDIATVNASVKTAGTAQTLNFSTGTIAVSNIALPFAFSTDQFSIGFMPKYTTVSYQGIGESIVADPSANPVVSRTMSTQPNDLERGSAFDLDAGITSSVFDGVATAAVVARHLLSPSFSLPNYGFKLSPEYDAGIGMSKLGWTGVVEAHDITQSNGGSMTVHYGVQWVLFDLLALRAGYNGSQLGFGAGIHAGPMAIDLAVDSSFSSLAGLNVSYCESL